MTTLNAVPGPELAAAGGVAPPFPGSKPVVLLLDDTTTKIGQGDRTCTCMISLPRGVADCLAPHPDGRRPGGRTRPSCMSGRRGHWLTRRRKLAAEARFALAPVALTGRRTTVVLLDNGGQARIRTVISSVWERCPRCWTTRPKLALVIGLAPTDFPSTEG